MDTYTALCSRTLTFVTVKHELGRPGGLLAFLAQSCWWEPVQAGTTCISRVLLSPSANSGGALEPTVCSCMVQFSRLGLEAEVHVLREQRLHCQALSAEITKLPTSQFGKAKCKLINPPLKLKRIFFNFLSILLSF